MQQLSDFNWIDKLESDAATALLSSTVQKKYRPTQEVYRHGDIAKAMYRVTSGHLYAFNIDANGRQILYMILGPGDCFGELGVIEQVPRAQTIIAKDEVVLSVLGSAEYNRVSRRYSNINDVLLRMQCQRLRMAFQMMSDLALDNLQQKLLKRLQDLAAKYPMAHSQGVAIGIHITQDDLAQMFGVSRQSVNRELKALKDTQCLLLEEGKIIVATSNA